MDTTIATPLDSVLGKAAKLHRVLREAGLPDEALQVPIDDVKSRELLVSYWNLLASGATPVTSFQRASDILGDDFVSPQDVANARGLTYSDEQLEHLARTLPSEEVLADLKELMGS